jgi:aspartyl aminopeptidase
MISATHSDSPAFCVKLSPENKGAYTTLDVEKYGGSILYTWLDRPLSVAGRVALRSESGIETRIFNIDKDFAVIPSLAIHLNREVNNGYKFNPAKDMLPLIASGDAIGFLDSVADSAKVKKEDIVSFAAYLYNRDEGKAVGAESEYILSPRLDNLECSFATLEAFLSAKDTKSIPVLAIFDNEEVGSSTMNGADSTFLSDVLSRISGTGYTRMLANSFMVSADNAHAKHPNHPELSDKNNAPVMNGGVVIKWNANRRYTTDCISDAIFKEILDRSGAKHQDFYCRADMPCGTTLGGISTTRVSIPAVDIGLAQLAMHSSFETAGAKDTEHLVRALAQFYSSAIKATPSGYEI